MDTSKHKQATRPLTGETTMNAHIVAFLTSKVVANGIMADQTTDPVSHSARKAIMDVWLERLIAEVK